MGSDWSMLLVEHQSTSQPLSTSPTTETQTAINGSRLSVKVSASILEDWILKQVIYFSNLAAGMKDMFLDKHGATSVLSAFEAIVKEKIAINVTCSIGLVENSISNNSYRPSDIIKSRKGLTV